MAWNDEISRITVSQLPILSRALFSFCRYSKIHSAGATPRHRSTTPRVHVELHSKVSHCYWKRNTPAPSVPFPSCQNPQESRTLLFCPHVIQRSQLLFWQRLWFMPFSLRIHNSVDVIGLCLSGHRRRSVRTHIYGAKWHIPHTLTPSQNSGF